MTALHELYLDLAVLADRAGELVHPDETAAAALGGVGVGVHGFLLSATWEAVPP
jgi:hypothetical protein